ncbi:DUF1302 domain-containing protein [Marinobacterium aestuarii]|nr:DUF1302 domain-containing protein [Marinobacterium aestuarii]
MAINNGVSTVVNLKAPAFMLHPLVCALLLAGAAAPAAAVEFQLGEIEGRIDSQISVGASWRLNDAKQSLISEPNGGTSKGSGSYDDGNQNFQQGETFSRIVKGIHDLELRYGDMGFFARGKYWFDAELENGSRDHGHAPNGYAPGAGLNDSNFNDFAKFSGIELLDAYWYGEYDIDGKPVDLRLGRQVVNWGESSFIQGGINVINPFDVSAFRRAGAEVKEGLLPVNMAFGSIGLTDNLSLEGFYQFKWEATSIDGCGTYFSTNDFGAEGCDGIRINSGALNFLDDEAYFNSALPLVVKRNADGHRDADDDGQFGFALRYFAEELNSTEFGLYAAQYHSRLPISSGVKKFNPALTGFGLPATLASEYFVEYPEDIRLLGLSFNTSLGDLAWSGEISHKRDLPIQINGPLLVAGILTNGGTGNSGIDQHTGASVPFGSEIDGYTAFDVTQVQTTFVKLYDRVLGASRLTLVGELAWTHIHNFDESADALKYGRNGAFGYTPGDNDGFVTADSFGYVARGSLEYPNAFAGISLTPEVSFKHGVKGYGPQPGAAFSEDQKALSLSLTGEYLNQYSVQLAYTNFFGGDYNELEDRDFVSLSASVAF